jgi:hypothetical protein
MLQRANVILSTPSCFWRTYATISETIEMAVLVRAVSRS